MPTTPRLPTAQEQLLLELANRLRLDPGGEAGRLLPGGSAPQDNIQNALRWFGVDAAAFRAQMAAHAAVAPLAWNAALAQAAETHTQAMIAADSQSHQLPGEAGLGSRITAAGYTGWSSVSENIYAYSDDPLYAHAGFVIDWGYDEADRLNGALRDGWQAIGDGIQDAAGHRVALLRAGTTEAGFAMLAETDPATQVGPFLVTQNFGTRRDYAPQLLGVVTADGDGDAFYDVGEGLGGVTVTATGAAGRFTTLTWGAGGYQMALPAGRYVVTFEGGALGGTVTRTVTMGSANLKLDARADQAVSDDPGLRLAGDGAGPATLTGGGGDDVLMGDGFRAGQALAEGVQIWRLYQAMLDRAPDAAGQADWTERLATGAGTLAEVAQGFVGSREFQAAYGALDNRAFVTLLYQNVLDRAPDAEGLAGWTARLAAGTTRAEVALGFSESREFATRTLTEATDFTLARDPGAWADDVFRLYQATLGRAPDAAGFLDWQGRLGQGTPFLTAVAGFAGSREFQRAYGAPDDAAFVTLLYRNVLDRTPDAAGLAGWLDRMADGLTRPEAVAGFAQSREFVAATAEDVAAFVRGLGPDDELHGGAGRNTLWGGQLSDTFVFDAATPGQSFVMDLEPWDRLAFRGFGHDDAGDIRARLSQVGADVVFQDRGTTVTLVDTRLADLTDAMFGF